MCSFRSVAVGMLMAAQLSARGWIDAAGVAAIRSLLLAAQLPVAPPPGMTIQHFMPYMKTDKKVKAGQMRFILLQQCGRAIIVDDVTEQELIQVFGATYG